MNKIDLFILDDLLFLLTMYGKSFVNINILSKNMIKIAATDWQLKKAGKSLTAVVTIFLITNILPCSTQEKSHTGLETTWDECKISFQVHLCKGVKQEAVWFSVWLSHIEPCKRSHALPECRSGAFAHPTARWVDPLSRSELLKQ